jgi:hypothetical protein
MTPIEPLGTMLHCALPWLTTRGRLVIDRLVACQGHVGSAAAFAAALDLRDRHQLERVMLREGLPRLERLAGWVRVLGWVLAAEVSDQALSQRELRSGRDPAVAYRTVKRVTGLPWGTVRQLGGAWVLLQLRDTCRTPVRLVTSEDHPQGPDVFSEERQAPAS